jgi:cation diffusion facilitator family transporter
VFAIFLQDSSALVGVALAGGGMILAHRTGWMIFDGIASLAIGILLFAVAFIIAAETKSLLIGEGASSEVIDHIKKVVTGTPEVDRLTNLLTMQLGPEEVLVNLDLQFRQGLQTHEIERIVDRIEKQIQSLVPEAKKIFIEVESAADSANTRIV